MKGSAVKSASQLDGFVPPDADDRRLLERFLLGTGEPPSLEPLRANHLGAYAFSQLPPHHPAKAALLKDLLAATAYHLAVKGELLPLIRAWRDADIEVLLFKGFYLAEFVYGEPSGRHYSDVDILLPPERAKEASAIAQHMGWFERWHAGKATSHYARPVNYDGHELMYLESPRITLRLDVHGRILHSSLPYTGLQKRFTRTAWNASRRVSWEGSEVRLPHPLHSLLIGLVLNRCWSSDDWELKPRDVLDFRMLVERFGITREALLEEARVLGCRRTLELFLERCDPFHERFDLRPPFPGQKRRWNVSILPERGHPGLERALARALYVPGTLVDMVRELPGVLAVRRLLRRHGLTETITRLEYLYPVPEIPSGWDWHRTVRGVGRNLKYLEGKNRSLRVLALFFALRKRGCPVRLCREGETLWLELDGRRLI